MSGSLGPPVSLIPKTSQAEPGRLEAMDQPSDVPAGRHTNTDSVSPGRAADRLGRFGIAATDDELDAGFHPEGVDGHRDADHSSGDAQWPVSGVRPAPT
jgi:hypothetical protein